MKDEDYKKIVHLLKTKISKKKEKQLLKQIPKNIPSRKELKVILKMEKDKRREANKYCFKSYLLFRRYNRFDKFYLLYNGDLDCGNKCYHQANSKEKYDELVLKLKNEFEKIYEVGESNE